MNVLRTIFIQILGFFIGAGLIFGIELLLLLAINEIFNVRLMPKGVGWLAMPLIVGVGFGRAAPAFFFNLRNNKIKLELLKSKNIMNWFYSKSITIRLIVSFPIFWIVSVALFVWIFKPYGYMSNSDFAHMYKVMGFPIIISALGYFFYSKIVDKKEKPNQKINEDK